jgi:hypothetical protein
MAKRLHTIYDMMQEKGAFDSNPANTFSRDSEGAALYKGPVPYPKMFYHPTGEEKIVQPGEEVESRRHPNGFVVRGEIRELISKPAGSQEEEAKLRAEGWHDHPSKAMVAAGKVAPPVNGQAREAELQDKLAALQAELSAVKAQQASAPEPASASRKS